MERLKLTKKDYEIMRVSKELKNLINDINQERMKKGKIPLSGNYFTKNIIKINGRDVLFDKFIKI